MSATACIILLVLAAAMQSQTPSGRGPEERRPLNVTERTALESRQAMVLHVMLTLASVLQRSDVRQTMTTSSSLLVTWVDAALSWNASDYGGVDTVEVAVGDVWMPNLYILNSQGDSQNVMQQAQHVKVNLTSQLLFHQIAQAYTQKNEWNLQKLSDTTSYVHTNFTGRVAMPMHGAAGQLSRKTMFYTVFLVLPLVLTSYMNTLVLLIPLESDEKVSFIESTSVFSGFFSGSMPRGLDTVPATMQLMAWVVVESFLVLLCTLFVLVRHHGSRTDGAERNSLPWADSQAEKAARASAGDNNNVAGPEVASASPEAGLESARAARQPGGKGIVRDNSTVLLCSSVNADGNWQGLL
ncbi:neuronal acetylcholine receptor subunit alpha-7-like [Babylonia areolata]|uniref:neuronal acetylcholine receptor subunit alpha-7-like n=1 Tax=Babylonia areolata TaxID=304850 RepID=UPI003FD509B6